MTNLELAWRLIPKELLNTLYMVSASALFSFILGLPLGILLNVSAPGGVAQNKWLYKLIGVLVNVGRAIPFAILIVAIFPFTRWIVGTSIGTTAAIVPLTIAATPFIARLVESALMDVSDELVEAAQVMGASLRQLVCKVFLPEALPTIIRGVTLTVINLIGYSAMAGLVGGGGLGKIAIQYGYQRFNGFLMGLTVIILVLLVEVVQALGNRLTDMILKKRGLA